jgi:hypothetical protein
MAGSINQNQVWRKRRTVDPDSVGANQPPPVSHAKHQTATSSDGSRQLTESAITFDKFH